jgi:LPXTG-site transpeptidase (sortase) family protein
MRLARINTLLLIAIVGINTYIISAPLLPLVSFWTGAHVSKQPERIQNKLHAAVAQPKSIPADNRLLIPAMQLDIGITEGKDARALRTGPWHRPHTSTPDKGGNTVIAAHRFTYTQPKATFYHLDAVHPGDEIGIFWQGKRYLYIVRETKTVPATATEIEAPTSQTQLTLYTCTPLWSPKDRLVVIAMPKEMP